MILALAWLIPLFPFLAFVAISMFACRNRILSHRLAIGGMVISFLLSQVVFWVAVLTPVGRGEHAFESALIPWLPSGLEVASLGVYVDPITAVMLFIVPPVCLTIFIYSVGYMHGDRRYSRFFAYTSLLVAGMLGTVVFNNLLAFFLFWGIMDACSYLLIGFQREKRAAIRAGLKAFLVTKVGDLFLLLGLALLYSEVGSLAYREVFATEALDHLARTPFLGTQWSTATVIALLLFGGTVGKSAQFPLHVWLPDAVEAPTPATALINAATTVPAGVLLAVRIFPLFVAGEGGAQMTVVAAIGAFTAVFSSIIAIAQNNIRRVLAFSAISQVGYMVAALGIGAYVAGVFHLTAYAFFTPLLFLGAGSVMRGVERGRAADSSRTQFNPNDMACMGGLARRQPITFWTFLIGGLALSGFPLITAGFWSQCKILARAYRSSPAVFWLLAVAAGLIAFCTMRQVCMIFLGQPRTRAAERAPESPPLMTAPLIILAVFATGLGWTGIAEDFPVIGGLVPDWFHALVGSPIETTYDLVWQPLAVWLAFGLGGLVLAWLVYGWKPVRASETDRVEAAMRRMWLGWLYDALRNRLYFDEIYRTTFVHGSILLASLFQDFDHGVVDGLIGLVVRAGRSVSCVSGWLDVRVVDAAVNLAGRAGRALSEIGRVLDLRVADRLANLVGLSGRALSDLSNVIDLKVVDGVVEGVGDAVRACGRFIRPIQTGRVQNYLLLAVVEILALVVAFLLM